MPRGHSVFSKPMCYEVITRLNYVRHTIIPHPSVIRRARMKAVSTHDARRFDYRMIFQCCTTRNRIGHIAAIARNPLQPLRYVNTTGRDGRRSHRGKLQNLTWRSQLRIAIGIYNVTAKDRPACPPDITHTAICASTMCMGAISAGTYLPSTCAIRIELRSARTDFQCSSPSSTYPSGNSP